MTTLPHYFVGEKQVNYSPPKGGSLSFQFSGLHPASERDGGTLGWLTTTVSTDLCAGLTV